MNSTFRWLHRLSPSCHRLISGGPPGRRRIGWHRDLIYYKDTVRRPGGSVDISRGPNPRTRMPPPEDDPDKIMRPGRGEGNATPREFRRAVRGG